MKTPTHPNFESHLSEFADRLTEYEGLQEHLPTSTQTDLETQFHTLTIQLTTIVHTELLTIVIPAVYKAMFMRLLMKGDAPFSPQGQEPSIMIQTRIRRFARVGLPGVAAMQEWIEDWRKLVLDVNSPGSPVGPEDVLAALMYLPQPTQRIVTAGFQCLFGVPPGSWHKADTKSRKKLLNKPVVTPKLDPDATPRGESRCESHASSVLSTHTNASRRASSTFQPAKFRGREYRFTNSTAEKHSVRRVSSSFQLGLVRGSSVADDSTLKASSVRESPKPESRRFQMLPPPSPRRVNRMQRPNGGGQKVLDERKMGPQEGGGKMSMLPTPSTNPLRMMPRLPRGGVYAPALQRYK